MKNPDAIEYGYLAVNFGSTSAHLLLLNEISINDLAADGKEEEPHVTILYGFDDIVSATEIHEIVEDRNSRLILEDAVIEFTSVDVFEAENYDVVYLKPADNWLELFTELREHFTGLSYITTHKTYSPHLTLAYVKSGEGDNYKDVLNDALIDIGPVELKPTKLFFRSANGDKTLMPLTNTSVEHMLSLSEFVQFDTEEYIPDSIFDDFGVADPAAEYILEELYDPSDDEFINEAVKTKEAVLKGKKVRKRFSTKSGFKIVNGKEQRMTATEKRLRKRSMKKLKRKLKRRTAGQQAKITRKRKKSTRKRTRLNVKGRVRHGGGNKK